VPQHGHLARAALLDEPPHHVEVRAASEDGGSAGEVLHIAERDRELASVDVTGSGGIGIGAARWGRVASQHERAGCSEAAFVIRARFDGEAIAGYPVPSPRGHPLCTSTDGTTRKNGSPS